MLKYKREFVTPQVARGLMKQNADNQRNLKWFKITGYVRDMINGDWVENSGETIKIDVDGRMIDGQNRVQAVIEAGDQLPEGGIYFDVVYGVPPEAMRVIDSGSSRTAADGLKMFSGVTDRNNLGAIIRWAIMFDAGNYVGESSASIRPTNSEIVHRFEAEPAAFRAATRRAADFKRARIGSSRAMGVAYYLFNRIDPVDGLDFFDKLISGANLSETSPILALRNRLVSVTADKVRAPSQLVLCVRGWNHYRAGTQIKGNLIISNDGKVNNAMFPLPK